MRKRLLLALALTTFLCSFLTYAQEKRKAEEKRDGLVVTYDKFRDRTLVRTERFDLLFAAGKRSFICSAFLAYLREDSSLGIVLVVTPGAGTTLGSFAESMDKGSGHYENRVYFAPDSDVILLIGGERHKLGRVTKDYGLTPSGDYRGTVFIEVPLEVLHAFSEADEWEMAIGSLETKAVSRYAKKLRTRLISLEEEFKKDRLAQPQQPPSSDKTPSSPTLFF